MELHRKATPSLVVAHILDRSVSGGPWSTDSSHGPICASPLLVMEVVSNPIQSVVIKPISFTQLSNMLAYSTL